MRGSPWSSASCKWPIPLDSCQLAHKLEAISLLARALAASESGSSSAYSASKGSINQGLARVRPDPPPPPTLPTRSIFAMQLPCLVLSICFSSLLLFLSLPPSQSPLRTLYEECVATPSAVSCGPQTSARVQHPLAAFALLACISLQHRSTPGIFAYGALAALLTGREILGQPPTHRPTTSPTNVWPGAFANHATGVSAGGSYGAVTCAFLALNNVTKCVGRTASDFDEFGFFDGQQAKAIAVGYDSACLLRLDSTVTCIGNDTLGDMGQLGCEGCTLPMYNMSTRVKLVPGLTVASISAGVYHYCMRTFTL
jgi:hypothetical protein